MRIKLCILGSGSSGNCTLIETESGTRLLVDAARLGINYIEERLGELGVGLGDINGVLATHMHGDHVDAGVTYPICRRNDIPLYVHEDSFEDLVRRSRKFIELDRAGLVRRFDGAPFGLRELRVAPFGVPHGSGGWNRDIVGCPVGFRISHVEGATEKVIAYATDLGEVTAEAENAMLGADLLVLECNHDVESERRSGRPGFLVDWVLGPRGHLSNEQCGHAVARLVSRSRGRTSRVLLAHISEDCNTPQLAMETVRRHLGKVDAGDVYVGLAAQHEAGPEIVL